MCLKDVDVGVNEQPADRRAGGRENAATLPYPPTILAGTTAAHRRIIILNVSNAYLTANRRNIYHTAHSFRSLDVVVFFFVSARPGRFLLPSQIAFLSAIEIKTTTRPVDRRDVIRGAVVYRLTVTLNLVNGFPFDTSDRRVRHRNRIMYHVAS